MIKLTSIIIYVFYKTSKTSIIIHAVYKTSKINIIICITYKTSRASKDFNTNSFYLYNYKLFLK